VIHSRLREVVPIAKASEACAIVTVSMDIEQLIYEGEQSRGASSLLKRLSQQ
jgi:hypothetical protein